MFPAQQGLDGVAKAFAAKIQELQELTLLRVDGASKDVSSQELNSLEASVQATEQKLRNIQRFISQEKQAVVKARALISACALQQEQLQYISTHLPARLPETVPPKPQATQQTAQEPAAHSESEANSDNAENTNTNNVDQPLASKQAADKKKQRKAPRRYVSQTELASVSSYMRGRLTIETVNAALDDIASHAESNSKLMAAARSNSVKPADRKRATTLLHCVAGKDGVRGKYWFLESDLKGGGTLKPDKTGKAILTVLRHLGRLVEVRVSLDGTPQVAHVLQVE